MKKIFNIQLSIEDKSDKHNDYIRKVVVNNKMQKKYTYYITAKEGIWRDEYSDFEPDLAPKEMLELGIMGGKYFNDVINTNEYPSSWFKNAKLSGIANPSDSNLNYFKVSSGQSLKEWEKNGWIDEHDKRGWIEWYFRFYLGRRIKDVDIKQIGRWKSFVARHKAQVIKNCDKKDNKCRLVQKQALLHWAIDSRKL